MNTRKQEFLKRGVSLRALNRLRMAHPDEYSRYYDEEWVKTEQRYDEMSHVLDQIDRHYNLSGISEETR